MFGQQQQAMDARDARNFEQGMQMFGMQQGAMDARDERNFTQQQQLEEARRAAEMAAQQAEIQQRQQYGLKPLTVPGTNTPFFQDAKGSIYTGSALPSQEPLSFAPVPGTDLMMPRGQGADRLPMMQNRGTIESPRPSADTIGPMPGMPNLQPVAKNGTASKPPTLKQIYEGDVPQNVQWNEQRSRWERVKIYNPGDPDDNGLPGDQSGGAGASAGGATAAAAPSALDKLRALRQRAGGQ
jgi:hypothetical protein